MEGDHTIYVGRVEASGVTDGNLLRGVRFFGGGCRTQSVVMRSTQPRHVRFVDQVHLDENYEVTIIGREKRDYVWIMAREPEIDPERYEAYTCLQPGARWDARKPPLHRDEHGALVWAWKADTDPISPRRWAEASAPTWRPGSTSRSAGWTSCPATS